MFFNLLVAIIIIGVLITWYGLIASPMIDKITKEDKGINPLLYIGMAMVVGGCIKIYSTFPELFLKMF